jgi:hypothetical protein
MILAPTEGIRTTNPVVQIRHSDSELDGPPTTTTKNIIHTEMIPSADSVMPSSEPKLATTNITTTANPGMQTRIEPPDGVLDGQRPSLRVLPSEKLPTDVPQMIDEVQQKSTKSDISMASNLDLDGRGRSGLNPAQAVLEKSPDVVEITSPSRKGKRKMIDREDDSNAKVPIIVGGSNLKRNHIMMIEEEDHSDIEYIGIWKCRTPKNTQNIVKAENVPIKLASVSVVSCGIH